MYRVTMHTNGHMPNATANILIYLWRKTTRIPWEIKGITNKWYTQQLTTSRRRLLFYKLTKYLNIQILCGSPFTQVNFYDT